jgi:replicative DNA helicase
MDYMPLLKGRLEELTDEEWERIQKAMKEMEEGIFVTDEDVRSHIGL